ncbi:MAG: ribose-5-phosphate isomerase RpiA [bacterium]
MTTDPQIEAKIRAATQTIDLIQNGMIVGLGSGSTAKIAIDILGQRVMQGLNITAVGTSIESTNQAAALGINLLNTFTKIDFTFDGADKVDPQNNLIKGYGGALTREKIVAVASTQEVIMVDKSKLTDNFLNIPIPVEVVPFGLESTKEKLSKLGAVMTLRKQEDKPFVTDNSNYILHCSFAKIDSLNELETALKAIPGVLETGLFLSIATKVIVG